MKAVTQITLLSLAVLCCLVVFGCGKEDSGGPPNTPETPTPPGNANAGNTTVVELRAAALKCRDALTAKSKESEEKAQELIKSLSSDDPEERKKLNAEMTELNKAVEALEKQFEEYIKQIEAKGGKISDLFPTE
jgi:hypothetical protein